MNKQGWYQKALPAGIYAWVSAVFFGAVLVDTAYSMRLKDAFGASANSAFSSDIADLLLLFATLVVIAGIMAIAFSWNFPTVRNLLIVSLIVFSLKLFAPMLLSLLFPDAQAAKIGPWIRILPSGAASILALWSLNNIFRGI